MGLAVLVLGSSGSGKSTSLRNFEKSEVMVLNVAGKALPFRKKLNSLDLRKHHGSERYDAIKQVMSKFQNQCKTFVIDDSQYLMSFQMFDKAKEVGYGKFTDIALRFRNMLDYIIRKLPDDVIVYFLHHSEITDSGRIKAKTVGKMLDNQLTVEGLFSTVLMAKTDGSRYYFETQSDGYSTCKSPMGMFEKEIDNDLKFVDTTIREYWSL